MNAIIYYTDNSMDEWLFERCQKELIHAAQGKRIVSVSQKPVSIGDNICVGEIGRSVKSLYQQVLEGANEAKTEFVALAEHDCMYTPEHFNWIPPDNEFFYYNVHHYFVQWGSRREGQYSFHRRKCMSNLICDRLNLIKEVEHKIDMLNNGFVIRKGKAGACEPGVCTDMEAFVAEKATLAQFKDIGKEELKAKAFATTLPNLDIRHGRNFSGGRVANKKTYVLSLLLHLWLLFVQWNFHNG